MEVLTAVVQNTHVFWDVMCRWASGSRRLRRHQSKLRESLTQRHSIRSRKTGAHVFWDVMCRWASGSRRFEGKNLNFGNHSPKDTALDPVKPEPPKTFASSETCITQQWRVHAHLFVSETATITGSVQSAKCVVHFSIHSSAKHVSKRHIFIVSSIHIRRNVCWPSSRVCDILVQL